jgi:predicted MPP superfamily phosphohydrolase
VITDITVKTCNSLNPLSSCKLDPDHWHRVEKDLYLKKGWVHSAYVHIKRKKEGELVPGDKVIVDVSVGKLDPAAGVKGQGDEKWEGRPAGIWLKRSTKRGANEYENAVTSVDVLFGADAVDPRPGWKIIGTSLLLENSGEEKEPRISIRKGKQSEPTKFVPRINDKGKFKIMQAADLHLSTGTGACRHEQPVGLNGGKCEADPRTLEFMSRLLDEEKPDLVVLSGDQVNGDTAPDVQTVSAWHLCDRADNEQAIFKYAALLIDRKIPFATIFGNHDDEALAKSLPRAGQMSLIQTLPYSLSEPGPDDIDGIGNYYVEVLAHGSSKHSAITLYLLDSHSYSPDERLFKGYDWLKKNQIDWFKSTAKALQKNHEGYSHVHLDLAFIHIPLPEYADKSNPKVGEWREAVTAPGFNSGFRDALVEQGVVMVGCGQ